MSAPAGGSAERGSGSALGVAVLAGVLALVLLVAPLYSVFAMRARLATVADAAALAAADTRSGFSAAGSVSDPCAGARQIAVVAGARLDACEVDGLVVTVVVGSTILGFLVQQTATAGPPPAESEKRRIR